MQLYTAAPTAEYARLVIEGGFIPHRSVPDWTQEEFEAFDRLTDHDEQLQFILNIEESDRSRTDFVEFRDMPFTGIVTSRTTETKIQTDNDVVDILISGGPMLIEGIPVYTLSIDVPDDVALEHVAPEVPPRGWPFRELWLTPELANQHLHTLRVYDDYGNELEPELVGLLDSNEDRIEDVTQRIDVAIAAYLVALDQSGRRDPRLRELWGSIVLLQTEKVLINDGQLNTEFAKWIAELQVRERLGDKAY